MAYLYDCHVHTSEVSWCGMVSAAEMVQMYVEAGYSGIVITDHYFKELFESFDEDSWEDKVNQYLTGFYAAQESGKRLGLNVLLGLELRFHNRIEDYLVFGVTPEFLIDHPRLYEHTVESFIDFSRSHDLLIIQAHPFRRGQSPAPAHCLDGVEVYNGNPRHDSGNSFAKAYAQEHGLIQIGGSDAHQVVDVGRGGIYLDQLVASSAELVEYLKANPLPQLKETN